MDVVGVVQAVLRFGSRSRPPLTLPIDAPAIRHRSCQAAERFAVNYERAAPESSEALQRDLLREVCRHVLAGLFRGDRCGESMGPASVSTSISFVDAKR